MRTDDKRKPKLFLALSVLSLLVLLPACQTLQTAQVSGPAVAAERTKQLELARKLRAERAGRLSRISARLQSEAATVCNSVRGNYNTSCRYPVRLKDDRSANASADGSTVYINTGIITFANSDDELALVVGHEIAHNMLSHLTKKMGSGIIGAIIDGIILGAVGVDTGGAFTRAAQNVYSKEYEAEADYLGLYLAARAGYNIDNAPELWRRMGIENPGSIVGRYTSSHPSPPERYVALESAVKEITLKKSGGLALIPNRIQSDKDKAQESETRERQEEYATRTDVDRYGRKIAIVPERPKKETVAGQWEFEAAKAARSTSCEGERPTMSLVSISSTKAKETYTVECGGMSYTYNCNWGDCQAAK